MLSQALKIFWKEEKWIEWSWHIQRYFLILNIFDFNLGSVSYPVYVRWSVQPSTETKKAFDNLLWLLVVCLGTGIAIYMSVLAWNTWKEAPVITSVSSTGLPLQKVDFPAITICSQGLIQVYIFSSKACSRRPLIIQRV